MGSVYCFLKRMKKIIFCFFIVGFLASCAEKEVNIPEDVLKQKEMTSILTDVHIAQTSISNAIRTDSIVHTMTDYLNYILEKHHTTKKNFQISLKFYSNHPEMLQQVYDSVITGLSKIEVRTGN